MVKNHCLFNNQAGIATEKTERSDQVVLRAHFNNFHKLCFSKPVWLVMLGAVGVASLASSVESRYFLAEFQGLIIHATYHLQCDEKMPECTQCASRGQKCPGATVGAVFVPMKPKMKKKAGAKGSGDSPSQRDQSVFSEDSKSGHTNGPSDISHTAPRSSKLVAGSAFGEFLFPTAYQPSKTAPFEQLFLDHFISAFDNRNLQRTPMGSWYDHLPAIYKTSPYQSCRESTRAAMMVHYGVMTSDVSIQTEAFRWYAKALESQRSFLRKDKLGHTKTMPAADEILSPIILALFELVSCTTPTGWMDHVTGAATMLEMRRPENCQTGLAHLVFRTIRPTIVSCSSVMTSILKI